MTKMRAIYHKIRRTILSWFTLPRYAYIEKVKVPMKNWMMHQFTFGGAKLKLVYEEELVEEAKKFVRPGMLFFDIGAGIGDWSYIFASLGCEVYAYESDENLQKFIKKIVGRDNLPIKVFGEFKKFEGVMPGFAKIDVDGGEGNIIMNSLDALKESDVTLALEVRNETFYLIDELKKIGYREVKRFGDDNRVIFLKK
ncbi:hypothetical protein A2110_03035 [Candidatus Jorgensenbacteria bacterium GWA1_54_12]|uniref:Methyltransferase FkbM domain-containing protein n=1 Tax=Candidatus Jorgensenbacteria bacterium GWA1_54_12 TaxID=1798468 RepID=A0A1F6BL07_9BACT|nr:MAG: FkbM family methyltransferase [Candidatus Jorgensenbacteria bacterium GW2011_GWB1_49_9]OGG37533.1 MAG: hypothetical protein A2110_03035 [Candidatus Jorgensenbacteria bacterium GWA1_54_12]